MSLFYFYFRMPPGTSSELCSLLIGLLRRNPRERMPFETFFNHPFLQRPRHPSITSKCYTYTTMRHCNALNSTRVAQNTQSQSFKNSILYTIEMRCKNVIRLPHTHNCLRIAMKNCTNRLLVVCYTVDVVEYWLNDHSNSVCLFVC